MLSIIVCSRSLSDFETFSGNVSRTVGVAHEIIRIDNSFNKYSISKAYNEGAHSSTYPYLCFVHEDVAFQTQEWGKRLIELLQNGKIGLVGVAGGILKTKATGPCWWSPLPESSRIHIVQHYRDGSKRTIIENPLGEPYSKVATIDGVFMATRKEVWQQHPFDEAYIKGFHFYDLDLSLSVGQEYDVVVTYGILLDHFSEGRNDGIWAQQADIVSHKWRRTLPKCVNAVGPKELEEAEKQTSDFYLEVLFDQKMGKWLKAKYIGRRIFDYPWDSLNLYYIKRWIKES